MKVFCFNVRFEGDEEMQVRYVLARDEEQAIRKIEDYRNGLSSRGFGRLEYSLNPTVEIDYIII